MIDDIELIDSTVPPVEVGRTAAVGGGHPVLVIAVVIGVMVAAALSLSGGGDGPVPPPAFIDPLPGLPVDVTVGTTAGDGPVLGPETGLALVIGGPNTPLRFLDLDTGDFTVSEVVVEPRFVAGSTLVYRSEGDWGRVPIDDIRSGLTIDTGGSRFRPNGEPAHIVPRDDETVWLTWPIGGRRTWQLIDLASLAVLREAITPGDARILGRDAPFAGPEVIGLTTGGVHELLDDGSYREVLGGRLVAVGQDEVLVRQCFPGASCAASWFDRDTWAVSDRPPPEAALVNGRLLAGDRLLAGSAGRRVFGEGLYDVQTGERLRSLGPTPLGTVAASPDGNWLLRRLFGRVEVVSVSTGESIEIADVPLGGGDSVIWWDLP